MNTYSKYCPNVFLAKCTEKHDKGAEIQVTTKYGQENECIVFNLIYERDGYYYHSIVRADGFNTQEWAKRRAERLENAAMNAEKKSDTYYKASNKDSAFLSLAEPIKIGHHSEKRHRKVIEDAQRNFGKCVEFSKKATTYDERAEYYKDKADTINLSMPESIEYFEHLLEKARKLHALLIEKPELREHAYSLTYAKKAVNEATEKVELARRLWA